MYDIVIDIRIHYKAITTKGLVTIRHHRRGGLFLICLAPLAWPIRSQLKGQYILFGGSWTPVFVFTPLWGCPNPYLVFSPLSSFFKNHLLKFCFVVNPSLTILPEALPSSLSLLLFYFGIYKKVPKYPLPSFP